MSEAFFNCKELAQYLRLNIQAIRAMAKRGELPCFPVGGKGRLQFRFPVKAIEEWIAKQTEGVK